MATTSSWKKRVEEGVPQQNRRDRRWYDKRDAYKRRQWFLLRKKGVRFGAFSGVRRQSIAHSCGDGTTGNEDDDEDDGCYHPHCPHCRYFVGV